MKNHIHKILFLLLIFLISCQIPGVEDGGETDYPDVHSEFTLCTINNDGSSFRVIGNEYNSQYVFFINNDENLLLLNNKSLKIVDFKNLNINTSIELEFNNISYAEISNNEQLLVLSATSNAYEDIFIVDLDNFEIQNISSTQYLYERYPSFSYDATKIIFTTFPQWSGPRADDQTISIYDIATNTSTIILSKPNRKDLSHNMEHFYYPKFDTTLSSFFYIRHNLNSGVFDSLFVYSFQQQSNQVLYNNIYSLGLIRFSENRKKVVFINNFPQNLIYFDLENNLVIEVAEILSWNWDYTISKDGNNLVYVQKVSKTKFNDRTVNSYYDYELWLTQSPFSEKKIIDYGNNPIFSKDGSKIAFYKVSHFIFE